MPVFADDIVIAADEWCPYNCVPGSDKPGYMIEIAERAFTAAGHRIIYKVLPWSRTIYDARQGIIDGAVGAGRKEVPELIFSDSELGLAENVFFVEKDSAWYFQTIDSLRGYKIGLIKDYSYGGFLAQFTDHFLGQNESVQVSAGNDALLRNIKMLLSGRLDIVIEDRSVFRSAASDLGETSKLKAAGVFGTEKLYIGFSPKNKNSHEYARILSTAIQLYRADGSLDTILKKYGLTDWQ